MSKFLTVLLFLLAFICVSCENKVLIPSQEISDNDTEEDIPDEDADTTQEPLFDLKVEANEKNVLSCRLTFSTSDEKKTFVKYYAPTHSGYKISENEAKTEHYFFLWGMRENRDYKIEIYSDEENQELLATTEFHSGILPDYIYKPTLVVNDKESAERGFLLFSQTVYHQDPQIPLIIMVDNDGFVIWYYLHDISGVAYLDDPAYIQKTKTIFTGIHKYPSMDDIPAEEGIEIDLEGNVVWKSPDLLGSFYEESSWHHEYKLLDDNSILFLKSEYPDNIVLSDRIRNVDRNYNEIWNWGYLDSPDYFDTVECSNPEDVWCDWTHTNSAMMFKEDNEVYFNSLWLGFFKMDMTTKNILWKFGKDGDFTMLSDHPYPWPAGVHDPKFADASRKRILFFDNGLTERFYSRIIEYEINEEAMTAEITFEYDGIDSGHSWFAGGWGDADYLENGNFLVTKGLVDEMHNSSVFEVTRDGRVVWELYTGHNDDFMIELYNADKFVPPLEFLE
ncbi:aryl-sulfate sulfotransferase [bacterium]|nr:aryl-sulfate sulfotransferase [bacterium]